MGETAQFKCNIKQSVRLSQRILCNEARECPCNSLQPFWTLWKIILWKVVRVCACVCGIWSKQNTGVSKANSASLHIWLKTKLRIDSEIFIIDPESLKKESGCIDGSVFSPTPTAYMLLWACKKYCRCTYSIHEKTLFKGSWGRWRVSEVCYCKHWSSIWMMSSELIDCWCNKKQSAAPCE